MTNGLVQHITVEESIRIQWVNTRETALTRKTGRPSHMGLVLQKSN